MISEHDEVYYVYALLDPRKPGPFRYGKWRFSHEPFYIGKGHGKRAYSHLKEKSRKYGGGNHHKRNKINQIFSAGFEPIVRIGKTRTDERMALLKEAALIAAIGRRDLHTGPLTNWSSGGEGSGVRSLRGPTVRKKISKSQKLRFQDPEQRAALGRQVRTWIAENPEKFAAACRKRKATVQSPKCRARASAKTFFQAMLIPGLRARQQETRAKSKAEWSTKISRTSGGTGIIAFKGRKKIGEYSTQNQAAKDLGVWSAAIGNQLRGLRPDVKGYTFRRAAT